MRQKVNGRWLNRLRRWMLVRLEQDHPEYRQLICNNLERLYETVRPGDVVLVEGRSRMSRIIKFFSSSHWSHVALYVGDTLIRAGHADTDEYRRKFGHRSAHLLVEAYAGKGVVVDTLEKYRYYNLRICRPYGLKPHHRDRVIADVIDHIGRQYDERNIVNIALMVLTTLIQPHRRRSHRARLGSRSEFEVICSGMIAKAFQKVGYPIVPALKPMSTPGAFGNAIPYGAKLLMRHFSQILTRDFDLSPNFEVIKFNILGQSFDYQSLWQERLH